MRFRLLDKLRLSPRTKRRLEHIGANVRDVVTYPVRLVFTFFKVIARTIAQWWDTRNLRFLLQGLPSFFLSIGVVVMAAVMFFQDKAVLASNVYKVQAARSLAEADQAVRSSKDAKAAIAMAQTCLKRLAFLQPDRDENSFDMARSYVIQRQPQAAEEIFKTLAPLPKGPTNEKVKSYGPAHLAMAKRDLSQRPLTPALLDSAQVHLYRAVAWKVEPCTSEAHALLFELLRLRNQPEQAEQHLIAAVNRAGDRWPEGRLMLAQWQLSQGKKDAAVAQAERAAKLLRDRLDESMDDHNARRLLVQALLMTGDYAGARDLCQQGMQLVPGSELGNQYRLTLGRILLMMYEVKTADPKSTVEERFRLLEQAIHTTPDDIAVLQKLVGFVRESGERAEKSRKHFQQLIDTNGPGAAVAHLILGTDFWAQGDKESAKYHWEKAYTLTEGQQSNSIVGPLVGNNLAWLIAFSEPPDPERALGLINTALDKSNDPKFHGTKGHILAKMGRHREAVEELEKAKTAYPNDPGLFKQLADSCAQIGLAGEAERYKKRAEELKKSAPGQAAGPTASPKEGGPESKTPIAPPDGKAAEVKPPDPKAPEAKPAAPKPKP
jgi:tetratricopeptide (TPR) repeat protein